MGKNHVKRERWGKTSRQATEAIARALRARARRFEEGATRAKQEQLQAGIPWSSTKNSSQTVPKQSCRIVRILLQNHSQMAPRFSKLAPKGVPKRSWNALGSLLAMGALILPLFSPPVGLLERSWTPPRLKKSNWKRLLDGPRPPRRLVSTILAAKYPPKRSPGGSQIEVRKRSKLKMAKP